jgi:hypothetical protein
MDIKFILLVFGLFIFTLGYVNQNKYNCNIIPSMENTQELKDLFFDDSEFLDYDRKFGDTTIRNIGSRRSPTIINEEQNIDEINTSQATEYRINGGNVYGQ